MENQSTIAVAEISSDEVEIFSKCLLALLSTERAVDTFAQVIDGKPTATGCGMPIKYFDQNYTNTTTKEIESRHHPDRESVKLFEEFRKNLRPATLRINTKTAQAFQNSSSDPVQFKLRLLEIVAVAIHTLAVQIYKECHPELSFPYSEQREDRPWIKPSLYHPSYILSSQYPNARADVVGYWAESRIFGGVVLFEHDTSQDQLLGVYINPLASHFQDPKIYQLSPAQILEFYQLGQKNGSKIPIPFEVSKDARLVGLSESFEVNIYRESYEKREGGFIQRPSCGTPWPGFKEMVQKYFPDNFPGGN